MSYKKILLTIIVAFLALLVSAESVELDNAIAAKNYDGITAILTSAPQDKVAEYEETILTAARKAVKENRFDDASKLSEIVLVYDFENTEAQNMYTAIQDMKNQEKVVEERKQQEAEAKAKKEEEERIAAEKAAAEEAERQRIADEAKKKEEYLKSVQDVSSNNFSFTFAISPLAMDFARSSMAESVYSKDAGLNTRYGFGAQGGITFAHPFVKMSLLVDWVFAPVVITGCNSENIVEGRICLGSPALIKYFSLTGGYRHVYISGTKSAFYDRVGAPIIGIGLLDICLPKDIHLSILADWNTISVTESLITFAFDAKLAISWYPGVKLGAADLYIKSKTCFDAIYFQSGKEWDVYTVLAVGVAYNEKH